MLVRALEGIVATALLTNLALPMSAEAQDWTIPPRKVEIRTYTCGQFSAAKMGEERDRILIYMNGYVDGTHKATHWDADQVAKRVEEVEQICKQNPKLSLLDAFQRVWKR